MATWDDLARFVRAQYKVIREEDDEIRIMFDFKQYDEDDERTQMIVLAREVLDKMHEWVQIATPVGLAAEVDLAALLSEVAQVSVVCGVVIMGEHVVLRHSLPLATLDLHEFVDPLTLLAGTADQIEEMYFGGDRY